MRQRQLAPSMKGLQTNTHAPPATGMNWNAKKARAITQAKLAP